MEALKIGIDLDGCLANFNEAFAQRMRKEGYNVPSFINNHPDTWAWPGVYGADAGVISRLWDAVHESVVFWRLLQPLDHDAFTFIRQLRDEGNEIYFITQRTGNFVKFQTEEWLASHGVIQPTVLMSPGSKVPLIQGLGLDYMIEDSPGVIHDLWYAQFDNPLSLGIINRPYNLPAQAVVENMTLDITVFDRVSDALEKITNGEW